MVINMDKIYLFDLGNVLAKPIDNDKLYRLLNCKISFEEFEEYWFNNDIVIDAHKGIVTDQYHIKKLLEYCKSNLTTEQFYDIYQNLEVSMYQDAIDLIAKLKNKGYKVGILSNLRLMDYKRYEKQLKKLNLDYNFLSYEMKCLKPCKEIYESVIKECNCNPQDIVFFDDNLENVKSAINCRINAYCVTGENIKEVLKKHDLL